MITQENRNTEEYRAARAVYMREYALKNPEYKLYQVWRLIKRRCHDPRHKNYQRYGARGIFLCDEWHDSKKFIRWALESGWQKGLQIDRQDNSRGYSPDNCWWTTSKNNNRNRGNNKLTVEKVADIRARLAQGVTGAFLAREYGVDNSMIYLIKHNKKWL